VFIKKRLLPLFFYLQVVSYSILIPIYNEVSYIPDLLKGLKKFSDLGHEILIINDGSNDGSEILLSKCEFIRLINLEKNFGKGYSLREGLRQSSYKNTIIYDGDIELNINGIENLMNLSPDNNVHFILGNRFGQNYHSKTIWDYGNIIFTKIFNYLHKTKIKDLLCCAKSFNKNDLVIKNLQANKFDIDVEITSKLIAVHDKITQTDIEYFRRNTYDGKKLKIWDSLRIIKVILFNR